jgi:sugar/nucleoside kinase (ribokinase family)
VETGGVVWRGKTRVSYAIVDEDERTILDERAGVGEMGVDDWQATPAVRQAAGQAGMIMLDRYCSGIHDLVASEVRKRSAAGERVWLAYRTGSRGSAGLRVEQGILPRCDACFTKRAFLESVGFRDSAGDACKRMSERFNVPVVVATLGKDGAAFYDRRSGDRGMIPALEIAVPATTLGGGDFFRAGFIYATLRGASVREAVRWASGAAGLHCGRREGDGLSSLLIPLKEIESAAQ